MYFQIMMTILLCACAPVTKSLLEPTPSSTSTQKKYSCQVTVTPHIRVMNWTGTNVSLEMGFEQIVDYGYEGPKPLTKGTVVIPDNSWLNTTWPNYTYTKISYYQASCDGLSDKKATILQLTSASFGAVAACEIKENSGWVILIPIHESCPSYTKRQEVPL